MINDAWVNYAVLALGLLFAGAVWMVGLRSFREEKSEGSWLQAIRASKDPTVLTVLFEDSAAMLGMLTALVGIALSQALDMPVLDGVASVIIGVILTCTAAFLTFECQGLLTGEGVASATRASLRTIAAGTPDLDRVNELLTMHFGPSDMLVALRPDFDDTKRPRTWRVSSAT